MNAEVVLLAAACLALIPFLIAIDRLHTEMVDRLRELDPDSYLGAGTSSEGWVALLIFAFNERYSKEPQLAEIQRKVHRLIVAAPLAFLGIMALGLLLLIVFA